MKRTGKSPVVSLERPTKKNIISADVTFAFILSLATYFVSLLLLGLNTEGDQLQYAKFYTAISDATIDEVPEIQIAFLGGSEPLYGLIMWLGSQVGIQREVFNSLFNALFTFFMLIVVRRYRAKWIVGMLLLSNFYFVVLLTSAERLKFGFMILVLALLFEGKMRYFLAALSCTAHFQMLGPLAGAASGMLLNRRRTVSKVYRRIVRYGKGVGPIGLIMAAGIVAGVVWQFQDRIIEKVISYRADRFALQNLFILLLVGLLSLKHKWLFVCRLIPIMIAAVIVGPERVNMIGVAVYLFQALDEKRSSHPVFLALMVYFSYKSIAYVQSIFEHRSGFYAILPVT